MQNMLNPSEKAKQRPMCGMLSVKVITVKGVEYELHMNLTIITVNALQNF